MNDTTYTIAGLLIPFFGTALGAGMVFLFGNKINESFQRLMLGFASGVMIAASVWSLLIPAIESYSGKMPDWVPAASGFLAGIAFLLLLDSVIPHLHSPKGEPEGIKSSLGKNTMLVFAVTLHNFPEGMAVGVLFASYLNGEPTVSLAGAFALAIGISIQNLPEGAVISMPLAADGMKKTKAFALGALSGLAEPLGAVLTILLINMVVPTLPYILSFAAGAMMYVVVEELIPESQTGKHSNVGTIGAAIGFVLMMILDVALG